MSTDKRGHRWTLAEIRAANMLAGHHFFDRKTMRFFGDTMRSFKVEHIEGEVYLRRVRPRYDSRGRSMGGTGELRRFDPATGWIGPIIQGEV